MQQIDLYDIKECIYFHKISVCAWCNKVMDVTISDSNIISHGICNSCTEKHILNNKTELM